MFSLYVLRVRMFYLNLMYIHMYVCTRFGVTAYLLQEPPITENKSQRIERMERIERVWIYKMYPYTNVAHQYHGHGHGHGHGHLIIESTKKTKLW